MASPSDYRKTWKVTECKIIQIAALPPGWWYDEHNRSPAIALVEWSIDYGDGEVLTGRDVLPLTEDLQLVPFIEGPWDGAQLLGDHAEFLHFRSADYEPPG